ncbi:MAG: hypothetical protein HYX61_07450 [Gammaproteobacteria bacterium]|nr:hypothetical protein [Gammaproteobacteria bacterium]
MNKLSIALLFSIGLSATPTVYAQNQNENILNTSTNLSESSSANEVIHLADWRWSRRARVENWCERHPRECHQRWCNNHPGACGSSWCERHPRKCRDSWCARHPKKCYY